MSQEFDAAARHVLIRKKPPRLKLWRLAQGKTLDAAAKPLGLSAATFREIEAGRLNPSPRVRRLLETQFGEHFGALMRPVSPRLGLPRERERGQ